MINNKNAFTLTELLVALGIVGAIAALSVPSLLISINNRLLTTQLKSTVGSVQQLIFDQLIAHKTKNLLETDFKNPATLLTNSNFSVAKTCADSAKDCWKTTQDEQGKLIMDKTVPIELDEMEVQDIDNLEDWKIAEVKYAVCHGIDLHKNS